jgi:hypothetical protein
MSETQQTFTKWQNEQKKDRIALMQPTRWLLRQSGQLGGKTMKEVNQAATT